MRVFIAVALFLTALLSLNSTLALQSANVTTKHNGITVTTTGAAMLGLAPGTGTGNAAQTAYVSSTTGALVLDFTRGKGSTSGKAFVANRAGLAYKDLIKYKGLFEVTNRSAETQCISVYVPSGGVANLDGIYIRQAGDTGDGWLVAGAGGARSSCRTNIPANTKVFVDFWWRIETTESGVGTVPVSFTVWVEGTR